MHYSNEVVNRLQQLYLEQFPEEEREDKAWDLSVESMKRVSEMVTTVRCLKMLEGQNVYSTPLFSLFSVLRPLPNQFWPLCFLYFQCWDPFPISFDPSVFSIFSVETPSQSVLTPCFLYFQCWDPFPISFDPSVFSIFNVETPSQSVLTPLQNICCRLHFLSIIKLHVDV